MCTSLLSMLAQLVAGLCPSLLLLTRRKKRQLGALGERLEEGRGPAWRIKMPLKARTV
jgi:hypothetical protein